MNPPKKSQLLKVVLSSKDLDLGLGLLYQAGISTLEQKRTPQGMTLSAELPLSIRPTNLLRRLRQFKNLSGKKSLFKKVSFQAVAQKNWAKEYAKHLQPFQLLTPTRQQPRLPVLNIDPQGQKKPRAKADTLYLSAGLAFGTGLHPTTQMAAELLAETIHQPRRGEPCVRPLLGSNPARGGSTFGEYGRTQGSPLRILDLGCGSGLLAMIAKKLGAPKVWAIDNDPVALKVSRENFSRNQLKGIKLAQDLKGIKQKFNVIVANILLVTLLDLREEILKHLAKNGKLILGGLLYKDCREIIEGYSPMKLVKRRNKKGWSALLLENS